MNRTAWACTLIAAAALVGSAALLTAGPLSPPAGPVAATHKTLTEVEPRTPISASTTPGDATSLFRLTQPGSYYLTGNVTGVAGKVGIRVAASNVTIDLNGFTLTGVPGSFDGINSSGGAFNNITILNGAVESWGNDGIDLLFAPRPSGRIVGVAARANAFTGISCGEGAVVIDCRAAFNGTLGFDAGNEAAFINCVAGENTGSGFGTAFGASFSHCVSRANGADGFGVTSGYAAFDACTSTLNAGNGFTVNRGTLTSCEAGFNTGTGYVFTVATLAKGCNAFNNTAGGFAMTSGCTLLDNLVTSGTTGILASGTDNRIEGNTVTNASTGISVTGTGNIILRNSVTGGTRYSIVAGNMAGPIVNAAGMAANTNPAANFDY